MLSNHTTTLKYRVPDLCCPVEFGAIERALSAFGTTLEIRPDYGTRTLTVTMKDGAPDVATLEAALARTGLECRRFETSPASAVRSTRRISVPEMDCPVEAGEIERLFKKEGVGVVCRISDRTIEVATADVEYAAKLVRSLGYTAEPIEASSCTAARRISIPEMDCPVEAGEIERLFKKEGVGVVCRTSDRTIEVAAADVEHAAELVRSLGYTAEPIAPAACAACSETETEGASTPWARYGLALAAALVSEGIELAHEYGAAGALAGIADFLSLGFAVVAILLAGVGTFRRGIAALLHGTLNMNTLMAVAVTGGVLIGAWPEAAMVMVLFEISEAIEALSMAKARRSIRELMEVAPETANVLQASGDYVRTDVKDVMPGAHIRVAPGERVPLDGSILEGTTMLDQSTVTGESMPAEKGRGETVWAGTVNLTATIEVLVEKPASQSLTARIIEMVENAQASKSNVQRFVDRFAAVYTPIVFAIAVLVAVVPVLFFDGVFTEWLYKALCLLVISCPCALVISTPVTVVSALACATRCGILIKGGLYLEEARKIRSVGLDKTGTLTKGEPKVETVHLTGGAPLPHVLASAASLASMNSHPLSAAIAAKAKEDDIELLPVKGFTALPGEGVKGFVRNAETFLLNLAGLERRGLATDEVREAFKKAAEAGHSTVALADLFGVTAVFEMADEVKEDAAEGLKQLKAEGITPVLLTGDNRAAASSLAGRLGLTNVRAELLPEQKLEHIRELQQTGLTAMVGDGINDAPALAQADIGIAMGVRGTESALEAANVALMDDRISSIATLVRLSRMTHSVLVQNIVFALGVKIVFAILSLTGYATMWMAVFADTGTCLIVVANGLRMLAAKGRLDRLAARAAKGA